jgi:hypothetical protein
MARKKNSAEADAEPKWDDGLKPRERAFLVYYLTDPDCFLNGRKAYRKAYTKHASGGAQTYYPADDVCDTGASRLLSSDRVARGYGLLRDAIQPEADLDTGFRLIHDCTLLATYNPADIINEKGQLLKPLGDMGEKAKCVAGITTMFGNTFVRLEDRSKYAKLLMVWLGTGRGDRRGNPAAKDTGVVELPSKDGKESDSPAQKAEAWNTEMDRQEQTQLQDGKAE